MGHRDPSECHDWNPSGARSEPSVFVESLKYGTFFKVCCNYSLLSFSFCHQVLNFLSLYILPSYSYLLFHKFRTKHYSSPKSALKSSIIPFFLCDYYTFVVLLHFIIHIQTNKKAQRRRIEAEEEEKANKTNNPNAHRANEENKEEEEEEAKFCALE